VNRSRLGSSAAACFALLALVARVASADGIEPPRVLGEAAVEYPAGGHGEAVVILDLLVQPDGTVGDVRVVAGASPFLRVALDAAKGFAFEPARRGGHPLAARVRIEVPFHDRAARAPPILTEPPRVIEPGAAAPKKKIVARGAEIEDVHVQGTRNEAGGVVMSKEDVRDMPGAFGDAFRAIDMMPGVVPIVSGLPFFFVRGAPPGNTGYFLDSVRVPLLFHLGLGPSVVHPSLLDRVDFYPGGYPAQFGRFTGGIVNGETRGPASRMGGEANVRLFDAGALGEAPFAGGKGDALVAGRYGYPSLLVPIFAPDTQLGYWDYQGRISYRVAPRDTLTAFLFGSFDELDQRDRFDHIDGTQTVGPYYTVFRTMFHRADLRWDHAVPGGNLRTALTLGTDNSMQGDSPTSSRSVISETIQLRTELDRRLSTRLRARAGADVLIGHYDYPFTLDAGGVGLSQDCPARNDVTFGGYADVVWRVHPRVEIIPGMRFDVFTSRPTSAVDPDKCLTFVVGDRAAAAPAADPRLAARVMVNKRLTWVGTLAVTHQPPSFVVPIPGGDIGSLANGLQSAVQASQGFEADLPWAMSLKGTFFLQEYFGMTDALASCNITGGGGFHLACLDERTRGRSFGLEVLLRRSFSKRIGGWLSYTFSRSTVEVDHPHPGETSSTPSSFDRPHVLNAAVSFDFGRGWHAGSRFTYYTGLPYTPTIDFGVPTAAYNSARLPDFWRLDVRIEKRWRLGARGTFALVLEGMNITFNKEAVGIECGGGDFGGSGKCQPQYIGPVSVPSLGVEAVY